MTLKIADLLADTSVIRTDPAALFRKSLDNLSKIYNGEIDLVDASSPLVLLMETSSVNTAMAIQENRILNRKQYPSVAEQPDEVYLHMSDIDFAGRFATPTKTKFTFAVSLSNLATYAVLEGDGVTRRVTIPRDTYFTVDGVVFTMAYPVDIRIYQNGAVDVSYDASVDHPLVSLQEYVIKAIARTDGNGNTWLVFEVAAEQYAVNSETFSVTGSTVFKESIAYPDWFYYGRAFYRNSSTDGWKEMITTHTDQVFDPKKPTLLLQVTEADGGTGVLTVTLPTIYQTNEMVTGEIRVDLYTTKGDISINLASYKASGDVFSTKLVAIDEERDRTAYVNAFADVAFRAYSTEMVTGGSKGIGFTKLREQTVTNSVGENDNAITNIQLSSALEKDGFTLVSNVDVLTNRIFLATRRLPKPINSRLITAANVGVGTLITTESNLATSPNVKRNGLRTTVTPDNLYRNVNSVITMLTPTEVNVIKALNPVDKVEYINSMDLLYSPFHYVLDNSDKEFTVRAYNLNSPTASNLSFESSNATLELSVNTGNYSFKKTASGYQLRVETSSGENYKSLQDSEVGLQLAISPSGTPNSRAYINGSLVGRTATNERIWSFDILTNHDINSDHTLNITNTQIRAGNETDIWADLQTRVYLLHYTTSIIGYTPNSDDNYLAKFFTNEAIGCMARESISLDFGKYLKNMWSRCRLMPNGLEYDTWSEDVPLRAEEDVFKIDPATGNPFTFDGTGKIEFLYEYRKGDVMKKANGDVIYRHRRGDVKLDSNDKPILLGSLTSLKEFDLMLVDGRYYFANDSIFTEYRTEIANIITKWASGDLSTVESSLLEKTKIYYYPEATLNSVNARCDGGEIASLQAQQNLSVHIYVARSVYEDESLRAKLESETIRLLDTYITKQVVDLQQIISALRAVYGTTVESFRVSGLGGEDKNYTLVKVVDGHARLCLGKRLELQDDNTMIVAENVNIQFHNTEALSI